MAECELLNNFFCKRCSISFLKILLSFFFLYNFLKDAQDVNLNIFTTLLLSYYFDKRKCIFFSRNLKLNNNEIRGKLYTYIQHKMSFH